MPRDPEIAKMCRMYNSDDSGIGLTVPDIPYPFPEDDIVEPAKTKFEDQSKFISVNPLHILAEIAGRSMAIARNEKHSAAVRQKALETWRKALMDQLTLNDLGFSL